MFGSFFARPKRAKSTPKGHWARWGRWAVAIVLSAYLLSGAFDCLDVKEPLTGALKLGGHPWSEASWFVRCGYQGTARWPAGASFPSQIGKQHLVATGQLKVYAVAFYLDPAGEKSSKLWSDPAPTLKRFLSDAPGHSSLRMVITSSLVTKHKLAEGLRESLKPRLMERLKPAEAEEVLEAFASALAQGPALKRGTQLLFTLQQAALVVVKLNPALVVDGSNA
eukprot:Skav208039  [mRNA]  locus=scaffold2540:141148:145451:+ [translate_table: standard]